MPISISPPIWLESATFDALMQGALPPVARALVSGRLLLAWRTSLATRAAVLSRLEACDPAFFPLIESAFHDLADDIGHLWDHLRAAIDARQPLEGEAVLLLAAQRSDLECLRTVMSILPLAEGAEDDGALADAALACSALDAEIAPHVPWMRAQLPALALPPEVEAQREPGANSWWLELADPLLRSLAGALPVGRGAMPLAAGTQRAPGASRKIPLEHRAELQLYVDAQGVAIAQVVFSGTAPDGAAPVLLLWSTREPKAHSKELVLERVGQRAIYKLALSAKHADLWDADDVAIRAGKQWWLSEEG